jgi:hypothetical protein
MHGPIDLGVGLRKLGDGLAFGIEAVNTKAPGLALERAGRIAVEAGRLGEGVGDFGAEEELVCTVAEAGDANGGVDGGFDDAAIFDLGECNGRARLAGFTVGDAVGVVALSGAGSIDDFARFGEAALRGILGETAPGIEGQILAVAGLAERIDILTRQGEGRDVDWRVCFSSQRTAPRSRGMSPVRN